MWILNWIYVFIMVVLLFGATVFIHEFGHFWMARWRGMKVEAFAIGFGPKIVSWVRDGIEYSWRWIPAGGFVRLPQMMTSDTLEGKEEGGAEPLPPAPPSSRILVALAGPFMNIVFGFAIAVLIYFTGLPVPVNPSIIGYVDPGSPEAKLGIEQGDRIVSVQGKPVHSWQQVSEATALARTNVLAVGIESKEHTKVYHLKTTTDNLLGLKMLNLDPEDHVVIGSVESAGPAASAGLKPGDQILTFAGVHIVSREQMIDFVTNRLDKSSPITVMRQGKKIATTVTPKMDPSLKRPRIGIVFGPTPMRYDVEHPGPLPWNLVWGQLSRTFATFGALLHSKETGVGVKDLSGPPGILAMLAIQVHTDFRLALKFLVLLNVALAILNLLPIPVLDGGHILFAAIEGVLHRSLSQRFLEYASTVFALFLIAFMLYVSFNDAKRWSLFKAMFQQKSQIETQAGPTNPPVAQPTP